MKRISLTVFILIAGCTSTTGVVPIGEDTYMIGKTTNLAHSSSGIKGDAITEGTKYCKEQGKKIQVIKTTATDMRLGSHMGSTEIEFMCLSEGDQELKRPKLRKEADTVIEVKTDIRTKNESVKHKDVYAELIKLDDLRKKGIISEAEFAEQKKKLLSEN